ncbi:MAG: NADH-quinone oxidoreductase subunit NuoK [Chloroflexi bacterium]|nr:NADH-quinone oxidoreductase subunit NuoK [Chloroflexota bacterium]
MGLEHFLVLSGALFSIGLYGALAKKNAVVVLMSIELMFNAVNVAVVAFSRYIAPATTAQLPDTARFLLTGQVFAVFVITVAAAEVALGLALVLAIYRLRATVHVTEMNLMKQ